MGYSEKTIIENINQDEFGRLEIANSQNLYDAQFTYNLHPLLYEDLSTGAGAAITHDATNRNAKFDFVATPTGGSAVLQSYDTFRYQPGKAQQIKPTFNFVENEANTMKFAEYGDGTNAFGFRETADGTLEFYIKSGTSEGDKTFISTGWDKQDEIPDFTKEQILYIGFEALYVGTICFGFQVGGKKTVFHSVHNVNTTEYPYIQSANLPFRIGMEVTGAGPATTNMHFNCVHISSSGGENDLTGYPNRAEVTGVAISSNAKTHIISLRPKLLFNGIENRVKFVLTSIATLVTGANNVMTELAIGQAITSPNWNDVNTNHSAFEFATGTISGTAELYWGGGYIVSSNSNKGAKTTEVQTRLPITLDAAGAHRSNGTISLLGTGEGGTSEVSVILNYKEIR